MPEKTSRLLHGHLVIFVDGYKYRYKGLTHFVTVDGANYAVPDSVMPAYIHEVGSMDWWQDGWAVGDNSRDRLCARSGSKPLRKFVDYDDAVAYIYARQKKNKKQQQILVYVTKSGHGREVRHVVRSMDDIAAIDAANEREVLEIKNEQERRESELKARYPELDLLRQKFKYVKAWELACILADLREKGRDAVMASMPRSSWYRLARQLREAGVEISV